jgi:Flp pilus assembly protein TadB
MKRLLVFALAASLGHVPAAFAGGSLLQSGTRHVQEMAQAAATVASPAAALPTTSKRTKQARPSLQSGQSGQQTLEGSGMRTRTKVMIGISAAVAFAASVWAIDHHVVDVTPSSLGTRQD